jgi:hypothetical protein
MRTKLDRIGYPHTLAASRILLDKPLPNVVAIAVVGNHDFTSQNIQRVLLITGNRTRPTAKSAKWPSAKKVVKIAHFEAY